MPKLFLFTDPHAGIHANEYDMWMGIHNELFDKFIIPTIKERIKEGDIICCLGDVFDNRTDVNWLTINHVISIYKELAKLAPLYIIAGNHDMYKNNVNVNALRIFEDSKNITIVDNPKIITNANKKILMTPYYNNLDKQLNVIRENKADILLQHSDLRGAVKNLFNNHESIMKGGLDIDKFDGYKRIYSGHIHIKQTIKNFKYIGATHHQRVDDVNDQKGITIVDLKSGEDEFIPNLISPEYKSFRIRTEDDLINSSINWSDYKKDFVTFKMNNSLMTRKNFKQIISDIQNQFKTFNIDWYADDINNDTLGEIIKESQIENLDQHVKENITKITDVTRIDQTINEYIESKYLDSKIAENLKSKMNKHFNTYNKTLNI